MEPWYIIDHQLHYDGLLTTGINYIYRSVFITIILYVVVPSMWSNVLICLITTWLRCVYDIGHIIKTIYHFGNHILITSRTMEPWYIIAHQLHYDGLLTTGINYIYRSVFITIILYVVVPSMWSNVLICLITTWLRCVYDVGHFIKTIYHFGNHILWL